MTWMRATFGSTESFPDGMGSSITVAFMVVVDESASIVTICDLKYTDSQMALRGMELWGIPPTVSDKENGLPIWTSPE